MSRVGKLAVEIPSGVEVALSKEEIKIKGKLGELALSLNSTVNVAFENNSVQVQPANDSKESRAMWGTFRSTINNMVQGVNEGFTIRLEINGVGYKTSLKGSILTLSLGYSHDIKYALPEGVTIQCEKPTLLVISGYDKQKVGQVAAELMALRPFEPYKGKGVFVEGKPGRRKEGKKK